MKTKSLLALLLSGSLLIAGCGGGGEGSSTASVDTQPVDTSSPSASGGPPGYDKEVAPAGYEKISVEDAWAQARALDYLKNAEADTAQAREDSLKKIDGIKFVICDSQSCEFELPSGERFVYVYPLISGAGLTTQALTTQSASSGGKKLRVLYTREPASNEFVAQAKPGVICASSKHALILEASIGTYFKKDGSRKTGTDDDVRAISNNLEKLFQQMGYNVTRYIENGSIGDANLAAFRLIKANKYDVVYISGHGSSTGSILTKEVMPCENCRPIGGLFDKLKVIGRSSTHGSPTKWATLNPSYWKGTDFSNRLFASKTCSTFSNTSDMPAMLKEGNTSAALGFEVSSSTPSVDQLFYEFFALLGKEDRVISEAHRLAKEVSHNKIDKADQNNLILINGTNFALTCSNNPPTVRIINPLNNAKFSEGATVSFSGIAEDSDGSIASYEWDFNGDGVYDAQGTDTAYTYAQAGKYTATLRVTDIQGGNSTANVQLEIANNIVLPQISTVQVQPTTLKAGDSLQLSWNSTNQEWFFFYLYDMNQNPVNTGAFLSQKCREAQTQTGVNTALDGCLWNEHNNQFAKNQFSSWVVPPQLPAGQYMIKVAIWSDADHAAGAFSNPFTVGVQAINQAPKISNLFVPSSAQVGEIFSISYNYSDPDGFSDVRYHIVLMSDNTNARLPVPDPQQGKGFVRIPGFFFESADTHWLEVYVEDSVGNTSNRLRKNIEIVGSTSQCSETVKAGSDAPETHTIELGKFAGVFQFDYKTYTKKDKLDILYEGNPLYSTGCTSTKVFKQISIPYSGNSTRIIVKVTPNCDGVTTGTKWDFKVSCPQ